MRRTGRTSSSPGRTTPLLLLLVASACHAGAPGPQPDGPGQPDPQTAPAPAAERAAAERAAADIAAALHASADAWDRGDLNGFLAPYADHASFVSASGLVRGRDEIRRRYTAGHWKTGLPPDSLRFEIIETRVTGPGSAWTVGRYILRDRDTGTTSTGYFSLVLQRIAGEWKIVHDHSTAAAGESGS